MTVADKQSPQAPKPAAKPNADPSQTPLQVQCFVHKGEAVIAFSQPVHQWFLSPEAARGVAKGLLEAAALLDSREAAGATKQ